MEKIEKARRKWQVGDTKEENGKKYVLGYTKNGSGKLSWHVVKDDAKTKGNKSKLQKVLEGKDDKALIDFASNSNNNAEIRELSYEILKERGVDVSKIEMNNGKVAMKNDLFGKEGVKSKDSDLKKFENSEEDEEDEDYMNIDFLKRKFNGLKTKKSRIEADMYLDQKKKEDPNYVAPVEEMQTMAKLMYSFLKGDNPLGIFSGGAGIGKTFTFTGLAKYLNMKEFDATRDEPGVSDYDYVEAPEIESVVQLVGFLNEHNGKVILFDDADNVLKEKRNLGILKKATNPGGKRIIGKRSSNEKSDFPPFEFTGRLVFLTNATQGELTKDENIKAIFTRAIKKDLLFSKRETLSLLDNLKYKAEYKGIPRLKDKEADNREREEVFNIIKDNIDNIDPQKFSSRMFMDALNVKRSIQDTNAEMEGGDEELTRFIGTKKEDWRKKVKQELLKGKDTEPSIDTIEKAFDYFNI